MSLALDSAGSRAPTSQFRKREHISRRYATPSACKSCRHRKVKCDGEEPCQSCCLKGIADYCHYVDPQPTSRQIERLSTSLAQYRSVLGNLFSNRISEDLARLPRERLLELVHEGTSQPSGSQISHSQPPPLPQSRTYAFGDGDEQLDSLHSMPLDSPESSHDGIDLVESMTDDVNALSLSSRRISSYLGLSSIQAVLKVIAYLHPGCAEYFARTPVDDSQDHTKFQQLMSPFGGAIPPTEIEILESYFLQFHPFAPMLDENSFRETYMTGRRKDDNWLALLNIVLALGSIAAPGADGLTHQTYFRRCKGHLNLIALGSSHIETIQALGLLGGWYCHYINQPNMAYCLMGVALRMAVSLGLHKEFAGDTAAEPNGAEAVESKRRVWWSLFCLDTWAGTTLGRPSLGRFGQTITTRLPQCRDKVNTSMKRTLPCRVLSD